MGAFSDLFGRLDLDPRVRGRQFEHVCKWFLTNDPLYKQRLRHVWLWKEWPDRPSDTEAGIDLVAEDADGHLWAVQAMGIPRGIFDAWLDQLIASARGAPGIGHRVAPRRADLSIRVP